ncbi:MAG: universal stress protein [Bdellovibrionota bacterium]
MATSAIRLKRILWAVDAFEGIEGPNSKVAGVLRELLDRRPEMVIEPIFIYSPEQLTVSEELPAPPPSQYLPEIQKTLENTIQQLNVPNCLPPKVISHGHLTLAGSVRSLSDYAIASGVDLIAASTHGRHGLKRLILGSFAESLLQHSLIPVLVIGPHTEPAQILERIMFPTDFTFHGERMFRRAVLLAQALRTRLTLFHAVVHPVEPVLQSGVYLFGGSWIPMSNYFDPDVPSLERHAEAWCRWANHQGVMADSIIDQDPGPVADRILHSAKSRSVGMIVMEAHSGPWSAALIGSVTRNVVRQAGAPVWVLRESMFARELGKPTKAA